MAIRFGTDGWRGIIGEDYTFDNVRACAQGTAEYLGQQGIASQGLLVGYDTRFASEHFAAAVAEVSAANGVRTLLCRGPAPTPVISYNGQPQSSPMERLQIHTRVRWKRIFRGSGRLGREYRQGTGRKQR